MTGSWSELSRRSNSAARGSSTATTNWRAPVTAKESSYSGAATTVTSLRAGPFTSRSSGVAPFASPAPSLTHTSTTDPVPTSGGTRFGSTSSGTRSTSSASASPTADRASNSPAPTGRVSTRSAGTGTSAAK